MTRILVLAIALLSAHGWQPARAETTRCTEITSLPAVLSVQGVYCLHRDLSTNIASGNAILIGTNNVILDCNGWKIGGLAAGVTTNARGIYANDRVNITIRNCGIRGFREGIYLFGADGGFHLIEHNRLDGNTEAGIYTRGDGNTIRGNRVYDTGGSTGSTFSTAVGIDAHENGDVIDNTVMNVRPAVFGASSSAYGIRVNGNTGGEVSRNRISGIFEANTSFGYGIWANGGTPVIRDNSIIKTGPVAADNWGIRCNVATAIARDNVIIGYNAPGAPVRTCTSINNSSPP